MPSSTDLRIAPHFDQYFGIWAMAESRFEAEFQYAKSMNLHLHMQGDAPIKAQATAAASFERVGSIAMIGLHGKLMKQQSSMGSGTSTVVARRQLRAATKDPDVAAIMLHIDSPGGTAAGTLELAQDIAAAAKVKPVHAYIEDLGASAAYWAASQATRIVTNATGMVGSIGTYGVVYDYSGAAAMEGVKAFVVRAGRFKGAGTPGTEITQEQLAEMQRNIDALNAHFLDGVASGRKMQLERVKELADGRVHVGQEAMALGLVDAVESFDAAFSKLQTKVSKGAAKMMSDHVTPEQTAEPITAQLAPVATAPVTPAAPAAATYEQLKAGCIGADAAFLCSQMEAKATLAQAQSAWMTEQNRRVEAARADAATAKTPKPGVAPITSHGASVADQEGDPVVRYNSLVREKMASGMDRLKASQLVAKQNPDLHAAFLLAVNPGAKAQRLIKEKFE